MILYSSLFGMSRGKAHCDGHYMCSSACQKAIITYTASYSGFPSVIFFILMTITKPIQASEDRHGSKVLVKVLHWRTESFTLFLVPQINTGVILRF